MHTLFLVLALNWNADLSHIAAELPKAHPNAFHVTSRECFEGEIESLKTRADTLPPHQVMVELARIVALIGDGHTRLTLPVEGFFQGHTKTQPPNDPSLLFHALPVRFAIFPDGLTIVRAADPRLLGRQVTRIGRRPAEDAIAAVMPLAHGDNELQMKEIAASYLAMTEVLHARGVTASVGEVPVTLDGGDDIVLRPGTLDVPTPQKPWSFKHLPEAKAVYFDFDEVANTPDETLAQFADRMFRFIDEQPVEKLIIDLRDNWGGNGSLNRAVLHGIIRSKKLQAPGSLFILTGRRTFSAAMMLVVALEQHTNAIFIGEPTAGSPNSYGDSRKIVLPDSGLTVRVSTLFWQSSDPRDKRVSIEPQIPAPPTAADFRANRDAALATALDYFGGPPSPTLTGAWRGEIGIEHQRADFTLRDGRITSAALKLTDVPLAEVKGMTFELRAGSKRLAGTLRTSGLGFLVVGERE